MAASLLLAGQPYSSPTPVKRLSDTVACQSLDELQATPVLAHTNPQVFDLRQLHEGDATVYTVTPVKRVGSTSMTPLAVDTAMSYSTPSSMLETAGKQDEVIRLKAALNEKDMELIELREQHMQLVARSQEARANWETALDAKDRAIAQLEEAIASRQRAVDAASQEASTALSAAQGKAQALEAALAETHATVTSQSEALSEQARQLDAARHAGRQEAAAGEARLRAVQQELATSQVRQSQLERELHQLQALGAEKDERLAHAAREERLLREQLEHFQQQLQEAEALQRQQPCRLQQQLAELSQQLEVVQHRAAAKEASSRKYKEAVRAFKVKLKEREDALSQRQAQVLELHTELSQLQRLLKMGSLAAANFRGSPVRHGDNGHAAAAAAMLRCSYSPGRGSAGRGSTAEDALAAAADELERLRVEVHGFHLELAGLQSQVSEKDALLQQALADAAAVDADRTAAAARAEEATQAAFNLERQLRETRSSLEQAEAACAAAAQKLAAAEAQLVGLQGDQVRSIRAEGELRVQLESLQEQLAAAEQQQGQLREQLKQTQQRETDATKRIQQLEAHAHGLEERLDASASEAGQLLRRADRHETATSTLQAQLEVASRAANESEQLVLEADGRLREAGRQVLELQRHCDDLARKCEGLEKDKQQAESAAAAAEARAAAAERYAAELDSQLTTQGRLVREAESAAQEWQCRVRQLEEARQELGHMAASSDAAVKQLQADLAQLQLSHSAERGQTTAQQEALRGALQEAKAAKAHAELKLLEGERRLGEMRAALDSQEQLLVVLRQQVAEGGRAAQQLADLEDAVQVMEATLAEQRNTVSQLYASAAASEGQRQAEMADLLQELAEKSRQLVDSEQRFSQLEALMQRIAARTGQVAPPHVTTTGSSGPNQQDKGSHCGCSSRQHTYNQQHTGVGHQQPLLGGERTSGAWGAARRTGSASTAVHMQGQQQQEYEGSGSPGARSCK